MTSTDTDRPVGSQEKVYSTDKAVLRHDEETHNAVDDAGFPNIDEKKVLRKMDVRLIPMLALLYLLSFLDVCRPSLFHAEVSNLTTEWKYRAWAVYTRCLCNTLLTSILPAWKHWQRQNPRSYQRPQVDRP
jgi:hypothetical protein